MSELCVMPDCAMQQIEVLKQQLAECQKELAEAGDTIESLTGTSVELLASNDKYISKNRKLKEVLEVTDEVYQEFVDDGCYGAYVLGEELWNKFCHVMDKYRALREEV